MNGQKTPLGAALLVVSLFALSGVVTSVKAGATGFDPDQSQSSSSDSFSSSDSSSSSSWASVASSSDSSSSSASEESSSVPPSSQSSSSSAQSQSSSSNSSFSSDSSSSSLSSVTASSSDSSSSPASEESTSSSSALETDTYCVFHTEETEECDFQQEDPRPEDTWGRVLLRQESIYPNFLPPDYWTRDLVDDITLNTRIRRMYSILNNTANYYVVTYTFTTPRELTQGQQRSLLTRLFHAETWLQRSSRYLEIRYVPNIIRGVVVGHTYYVDYYGPIDTGEPNPPQAGNE